MKYLINCRVIIFYSYIKELTKLSGISDAIISFAKGLRYLRTHLLLELGKKL